MCADACRTQDKERVRLLHVAADEHQDGYREAMTGKGKLEENLPADATVFRTR